jgi:hypothetical protein
MMKMFIVLCFCYLAANGAELANISAIPGDPKLGVPLLMPPGVFTADVMMPGTPRTADISMRMAKAIQANPEWWSTYAKANIKDGEVLPYHPNMGISKSEWDEIGKSAADSTMTKLGTATLRIEMLSQDRFGLSATSSGGSFDQVVLDLVNNRVETPYGVTTGFVFAVSSATGDHRGCPRYEWSYIELSDRFLDNISRASCHAAMVAIGQDQQTGKTLFRYKGKRIEAGRKLQEIDAILMFRPQTETAPAQ